MSKTIEKNVKVIYRIIETDDEGNRTIQDLEVAGGSMLEQQMDEEMERLNAESQGA